MEFGFNYMTEAAKDLANKHGIKYRMLSADTVKLYSSTFDQEEEDFRERGIKPDDPDRQKRYLAQGTRVWKSPEGVYYYLIDGAVFYMRNRITLDYSTYPATQFVTSVLDAVDVGEQDTWRERLLAMKTLAQSPLI